jgi:uncharacterized membrane protein
VLEYVFWLCGLLLAACAVHDLRARRWASATFWGLVAAAFLGGDAINAATNSGNAFPAQCAGIGVIVLGLIAGSGVLRRRQESLTSAEMSAHEGARSRRVDPRAQRVDSRLFWPALVIPFGTLALTLLQPYVAFGGIAQIERATFTLIAFALACVLAVIVALALTRTRVADAVHETSRLLDALSWAVLLPMLLAMLGAVFAATGVGEAIAHLVAVAIPTDSRAACLLAFSFGMVAFTVIMGNAFAAFPVMMAGIGMPLLIAQHHALPAVLGALGMLTGYCGTLLTPMAANFNVVPAALLELRDPHGVIRAQAPNALALLAFNVILLWFCAFP